MYQYEQIPLFTYLQTLWLNMSKIIIKKLFRQISESILYNVEINIEALFNVSTHIHFGIAALVAVQDDVDFGPQIMPNFIFRKCELYFVEKL